MASTSSEATRSTDARNILFPQTDVDPDMPFASLQPAKPVLNDYVDMTDNSGAANFGVNNPPVSKGRAGNKNG